MCITLPRAEGQNDMDRWTNQDNNAFYEAEAIVDVLKGYAKIAGFDKHCDVAMVSHLLFDAKSIIDIGAGYGRVIDYLLEKNYKGELFALERSPIYCDILNEKYKGRVNLFKSDIQSFTTDKKFEVAIWMWSGISDFAKAEQAFVFNKIFDLISDGGVLILDTLLHSIKPVNAIESNNQYYLIQSGEHKVQGYIPSEAEINEYAKNKHFKSIEHLHYATATGRQRVLHIIFK